MANRKIVTRKREQPMLPRVSGTAPYEWLLGAIEQYADDNDVRSEFHSERRSRSTACCILLAKGLKADLETVRVFRTFPSPRSARNPVGEAQTAMIPAFSVPEEYNELPVDLNEALEKLRDAHVKRARSALKTLITNKVASDAVGLRGWRTILAGLDGVTLRLASESLSEAAMIDLCDCMTDDMVLADVMRALWAVALEAEGLAPAGWDKRRVVGVSKMLVADHEVR